MKHIHSTKYKEQLFFIHSDPVGLIETNIYVYILVNRTFVGDSTGVILYAVYMKVENKNWQYN